tara:strand:+ start:5553 stop:7028 length:1476 start_codon:yes stop_codon:yes gene_type:complete
MKMENTVFKDFTEQKFSEEILKGLINSIVEFMKEKNIDLNSIVDLSNDIKINFYDKLKNILEYITIHIFNNNCLEELIKDFIKNFNNSISEKELVKVKNEKYFIKKKDEIKDLILEIHDVFKLITNFEYINEHKEILFNDEPNDESNQKFGYSLNYVISDLSRSCENLNDSLCKVNSNLTKDQLIKDLDDSLCKDNFNKTMKDLNDSICKAKELNDINQKIKNLCDPLSKDNSNQTMKDLNNSVCKIENFIQNDLLDKAQPAVENFIRKQDKGIESEIKELSDINQTMKDLNDLLCKDNSNQTMKDLNNSFCKANSAIEDLVMTKEIVNEIKELNNLNNTEEEILKKLLSFLKSDSQIDEQNKFNKNNIPNLEKILQCSSDKKKLNNNKIKLLREELDKIKFNLLKNEEHQGLIKKYECGEIIKELNNKVYQKPFDELNDIRYQNEIRRIVNIYNNSSKELHDQIEVFNKMKYFIELGKDNQPFQTVFDAK